MLPYNDTCLAASCRPRKEAALINGVRHDACVHTNTRNTNERSNWDFFTGHHRASTLVRSVNCTAPEAGRRETPDIEAYMAGKDAFIKAMERTALALRDEQRSLPHSAHD